MSLLDCDCHVPNTDNSVALRGTWQSLGMESCAIPITGRFVGIFPCFCELGDSYDLVNRLVTRVVSMQTDHNLCVTLCSDIFGAPPTIQCRTLSISGDQSCFPIPLSCLPLLISTHNVSVAFLNLASDTRSWSILIIRLSPSSFVKNNDCSY
jgi:hypothetical protein